MRAGAKIAFARKLRGHLTPAEGLLWSRLRRQQVGGFRFRRQHPIGPYIADFACIEARLVVELDGISHGAPQFRADMTRMDFMESLGWRVVRFSNGAVRADVNNVAEGLLVVCLERVRALPPPSALLTPPP
jgi:very-short-patch-repair endonuclease